MLVDLMGMGRPPEDVSVDSPIIKKLDMAYRQTLNATADVLGITLSDIDVSRRTPPRSPTTSRSRVGTIDAGTVVGQRFSWVGHLVGPSTAGHPRGVGAHPRPPQWGLKPLAAGEKAPLIRAVIQGMPSFELQLDVGWDDEVPAGSTTPSPAT